MKSGQECGLRVEGDDFSFEPGDQILSYNTRNESKHNRFKRVALSCLFFTIKENPRKSLKKKNPRNFKIVTDLQSYS